MQSEKASSEPGRILAFLVAHGIDQEWELENIVVAEESRRHGIGARLINELIDLARANHGRRMFLEVRESNYVARALYRKMGFRETGSRVDYYSDPSEDAIVYRLSL
ncbi:MAG TPA: ribosomal protein S18-alanine N-acetyltransferase [Candidatus Acidoferrales bacterium]|jgi:ribosomal-protein-alanine N-acetyltransferase|nr:ribosomal protein S18-alanine N-acetyltransferase [Candidatus Acidoferrales bacterium]